MKLKDLREYCKSQDNCDNCEYIGACIAYFGGCIPSLDVFDPSRWQDYVDWDAEIIKDKDGNCTCEGNKIILIKDEDNET